MKKWGFMKSLFDVSFTRFVSPSVVKIVYILIMVLVAIAYIVMVFAGFQSNAGLGLLMLVVVGPLVALIYLALARVGLESLIASIRTAENTAELVRLGGGNSSGGGSPSAAPQTGPYGGNPPAHPASPGPGTPPSGPVSPPRTPGI